MLLCVFDHSLEPNRPCCRRAISSPDLFCLRRSNGDASVDNQGLACRKLSGLRRQENGSARDIVGIANPAKRGVFDNPAVNIRIAPKRLREIGTDQSRGDAIGANVAAAPFDRDVAGELLLR